MDASINNLLDGLSIPVCTHSLLYVYDKITLKYMFKWSRPRSVFSRLIWNEISGFSGFLFRQLLLLPRRLWLIERDVGIHVLSTKNAFKIWIWQLARRGLPVHMATNHTYIWVKPYLPTGTTNMNSKIDYDYSNACTFIGENTTYMVRLGTF